MVHLSTILIKNLILKPPVFLLRVYLYERCN